MSFWSSTEIWKQSYRMENLSYLPIVPVFKIHKTEKQNEYVFIDSLTDTNSTDEFNPEQIIRNLNENKSPHDEMLKLEDFCLNKNVSHACLLIGRIYEFGSYIFPENISHAYSFYLKSLELGSKSVLPILSYFHRHYFIDIERSIVESDLSQEYLESAIPMSFEYKNGISRPFSCEKSAEILKPFSYAATSIIRFKFPETYQYDLDEKNHAKYLFDAKSLLLRPYVSPGEISEAQKLLNESLNYQYYESASILAHLHLDGYVESPNISLIKRYLNIGLNLKDPLAYYLASCYYSIDDNRVSNHQFSFEYLKKSARQGFSPSIHRIGQFTQSGILGFKKNAPEAHKLFLHSALLGYQPSLYKIAQNFLNGEGIELNCSSAYENLLKILDSSPLSVFLDRYVKRGSKSAYLKMIDLNFQPSKFIQINLNGTMTEKLLELNNFSGENENVLLKNKLADTGNESAIIYLILTAPLEEALEWEKKMNMLSPVYFFLSFPIKIFLFVKNLWKYKNNQLNENEVKILKEIESSVAQYLTIILTLATLILFICLRVSKIFKI